MNYRYLSRIYLEFSLFGTESEAQILILIRFCPYHVDIWIQLRSSDSYSNPVEGSSVSEEMDEEEDLSEVVDTLDVFKDWSQRMGGGG